MEQLPKSLALLLLSLALLLCAVSSLGVGAAAAATTFHSSWHPQTINGSQTTSFVFTTNAGTVTCGSVTVSGTTSASTSSTATVAGSATEPASKCTAFGFVNVPVYGNGCGAVANASGTTEVECPVGKKIMIVAPFCTTSVGPQHIASGVSYSNNSGDVVVKVNIVSEIDYNECGTNRTNGSLTGTMTVTGASGNISVS